MRTPEELEKVAFRETRTADEDDLLAAEFARRAVEALDPRKRIGPLKQAAFFAGRAFDKGSREPERLAAYVRILTEAQRASPADSFRRKLAEMRPAQMGKQTFGVALRRLARAGKAGPKKLLATDEQLDSIEAALAIHLPMSYRGFLERYAHRQIGTYEPYVASELVDRLREAHGAGLESHLLPFLEDNGDYFCFDLRSAAPEPPVVFWDHNGPANPETWPNFAAWVEECWLGELAE